MRYAFLLLLFAACASARPQSSPKLERFFIDPVGREYYLFSDGAFSTPNPLGQNEFAFYDSSLGKPDVVDVTNPFAVLLYYADYGNVVILDRTLSEIRRLNLFEVEGAEQPVLMARATDNGIWFFDSWDYRLKLLDQRSAVSSVSNDLRLEAGINAEPEGLFVYQNLVLLHFWKGNRMAIFTNYGRFERWVSLPEASQYCWQDGRLAGWGPKGLWTYDLRTNKVARSQGQSDGVEQWMPVTDGYRWFDPVKKRTTVKEN